MQCTVDDAFSLLSMGVIKKYFCQEIFVFFQSTEMVVTLNWGQIETEIQI